MDLLEYVTTPSDRRILSVDTASNMAVYIYKDNRCYVSMIRYYEIETSVIPTEGTIVDISRICTGYSSDKYREFFLLTETSDVYFVSVFYTAYKIDRIEAQRTLNTGICRIDIGHPYGMTGTLPDDKTTRNIVPRDWRTSLKIEHVDIPIARQSYPTIGPRIYRIDSERSFVSHTANRVWICRTDDGKLYTHHFRLGSRNIITSHLVDSVELVRDGIIYMDVLGNLYVIDDIDIGKLPPDTR